MARGSEDGHFFLLKKKFQSQYGYHTAQSDEVKAFDNECITLGDDFSYIWHHCIIFIGNRKNSYSCVQFNCIVIKQYQM